jgi:uncharacterized membrane protein YfcA
LSSGFILVNSVAALMGVSLHTQEIPRFLPVWMVVVAVGGWLGSGLGARKLSPQTLHWLLAAVLVIAGARIVLLGGPG